MEKYTVKVIQDGNIEQCRDLCNELMAFQMSKATMHPECFKGMNFDTRMKASRQSALRSHTAVALCGDEPVGYVFSTIDEHTEESRESFPDWAPKMGMSFLPDWVELPQNIGCLSNLYLRDACRGHGLGERLLQTAMEWLTGFADVKLIFVYISNGNSPAMEFYLKHGFQYSHEVFGGFISAAYKKI